MANVTKGYIQIQLAALVTLKNTTTIGKICLIQKVGVESLQEYSLGVSLLLVGVGEVVLEVLGHAEALLPLGAEDRLHQVVGGEPLLVLGILE